MPSSFLDLHVGLNTCQRFKLFFLRHGCILNLFVPEFRAGTEVLWSSGSPSPLRRSRPACPTSAPCPRKGCCPQDLPPTSPACGIPRHVVGTQTRCALGSTLRFPMILRAGWSPVNPLASRLRGPGSPTSTFSAPIMYFHQAS